MTRVKHPDRGEIVIHSLGGIIVRAYLAERVLSHLIPGPDDGRVSVERARLEGADAFKVVPGTHTFLMIRPDVARYVIRFLEEGRFEGDG